MSLLSLSSIIVRTSTILVLSFVVFDHDDNNIFFVNGQEETTVTALDIPRYRTPYEGDMNASWPVSNVTGCGFLGYPVTGILDTCTEPLNAEAPDLVGFWRDSVTGRVVEKIEMCGSRWIDISAPVVHDFLVCSSEAVPGDGYGCEDYAANTIMDNDGLCSPISVACRFETSDTGDRCVNLYASLAPGGPLVNPASRCLSADGNIMTFNHMLFGETIYERVPEDEEPNCMRCAETGEHGGVTAYSVDDVLPCPYQERQWVRCSTEEEDTAAAVAEEAAGSTIVDLAQGTADLSTLVELVAAAGLVDTLGGDGPFTVFAPTNAAFDAVPAETMEALGADVDALTNVLTYHVVPGIIMSTDLAEGAEVTALNEGTLTVTSLSPPTINESEVVQADIMASNGVVHVIDAVLMPPPAAEETTTTTTDDGAEDTGTATIEDGGDDEAAIATDAADAAASPDTTSAGRQSFDRNNCFSFMMGALAVAATMIFAIS